MSIINFSTRSETTQLLAKAIRLNAFFMRRMESNKFCHLKRFNILSLDSVLNIIFIKFCTPREEFQSELWRKFCAASFCLHKKFIFSFPPSTKKSSKFYLHCCTWLHFQESWIFSPSFFYDWAILNFFKKI